MPSPTRAISSGLSNCRRNAPVETGVVSLHRAGRFSSMTTRSPARQAKNAVAAPTIPPPITTTSAVRGRSSARRSRGQLAVTAPILGSVAACGCSGPHPLDRLGLGGTRPGRHRRDQQLQCFVVGSKLKAHAARDRHADARAKLDDLLVDAVATPHLARASDAVPQLLDRAMSHRLGDLAPPQRAMHHAAALNLHELADL